jgi:hypothetical protein
VRPANTVECRMSESALHCLQHAQHARSALRRSAGWMLAWPSERSWWSSRQRMVMTWMAWIGPEIPEYSARVWAGVPIWDCVWPVPRAVNTDQLEASCGFPQSKSLAETKFLPRGVHAAVNMVERCRLLFDHRGCVRVGCSCVTKATDQRGVLHFPTSLNNSFSWYGTGW